jgi:hypothetical protein
LTRETWASIYRVNCSMLFISYVGWINLWSMDLRGNSEEAQFFKKSHRSIKIEPMTDPSIPGLSSWLPRHHYQIINALQQHYACHQFRFTITSEKFTESHRRMHALFISRRWGGKYGFHGLTEALEVYVEILKLSWERKKQYFSMLPRIWSQESIDAQLSVVLGLSEIRTTEFQFSLDIELTRQTKLSHRCQPRCRFSIHQKLSSSLFWNWRRNAI